MNYLSRIEEILLLAIWKLKDNAYGISIRDLVGKDTGIEWMSGAIYAPLSRLKKNGYVETYQAKGSTEKGGRPRIYYKLSFLGMKKLVSIQEVNKSVWLGVPDLKNKAKS
ncbi:MAG: helix-turn-helix transcriptional regulator [Candidatus Aminicenantaceae bacterium]|jgi:DNA-binding PadR family transcriptional regulator